MSLPSTYKVFARTYRPQAFSDVIGQEVAVKIFQNALQNNTLSHAIILTGIRGVGKTTSARLLAKTLCCLSPKALIDPCNECVSCKAFNEGKHTDVIEMDAASHTGVDDIRDIIEGVSYAPAFGRYRVYIVDEIHMLSKNAFNAFLKTLEEPPAHAKFIFATTEIEKVPETILSRCLQIQLKPMSSEAVQAHLQLVCNKEKLEFETDSLSLVAAAAQGSMRDALSILEKVASYVRLNKEVITSSLVERILGRPPQEELLSMCEAIKLGETPKAIEIVRGCFQHNVDPKNIAKGLLTTIHAALCRRIGVSDNSPVSPFQDLDVPQLNRLWSIVSKSLQEIVTNPLPEAACEIMLIRLCHVSDLPPLKKIVEDIEKVQSFPSEGGGESTIQAQQSRVASDESEPAASVIRTFDQLLEWVETQKEPHLSFFLKRDLRVHTFFPGRIECSLKDSSQQSLIKELKQLLREKRQENWVFELVQSTIVTSPLTMHEQLQARESEEKQAIIQSDLVQSALTTFKGSTVTVEKANV